MGNFDRDSRGPKQFGKRDFGGGNRGGFGGGGRGFGGDRDGGRPTMHKATCSKCGKECLLPFRPSGGREVFCSACFELQGNAGQGRPMGNNFNKFNKKSNNGSHPAICAKCGAKCEVPFLPIPGKPIYCKQCFDRGGNAGAKSTENYKEQFEMLNIKLDRILRALNSSSGAEVLPEVKKTEEAQEVKKDKKPLTKIKPAAKKSAPKKKSK